LRRGPGAGCRPVLPDLVRLRQHRPVGAGRLLQLRHRGGRWHGRRPGHPAPLRGIRGHAGARKVEQGAQNRAPAGASVLPGRVAGGPGRRLGATDRRRTHGLGSGHGPRHRGPHRHRRRRLGDGADPDPRHRRRPRRPALHRLHQEGPPMAVTSSTAATSSTEVTTHAAVTTPTAATTETAPAFEVTGLRFEYREGRQVTRPIDGVDLHIPRGQFVCILGPSGQGKSTLLRCLAGLLTPTGGQIRAGGVTVDGPGADRGMVFQQDAIPMWLRVEDNIAFGPKSRGVPESEYRPRVERYLEEVGLAAQRRSWPRQLSGGMRKRVAIAAVFANDPDILLMDEPSGALDSFTPGKLRRLLIQRWAETGKTIF